MYKVKRKLFYQLRHCSSLELPMEVFGIQEKE